MVYHTELGPNDHGRITLFIGDNHWPFAIPLVHEHGKWRFDTAAGRSELTARRIGANELDALQVCLAIHLAELEYQSQVRAGNPGRQYAARFLSSPGKQNGLYWPTNETQAPSPLGELVARAAAEGYTPSKPGQPTPYRGYLYKLLSKQGEAAPGGARNYLKKGRLTEGYALLAYPAKWGSSGLMTFMMGPQGKVYQRNLGPKTAQEAAALQAYDPDPSWKPALPTQPSFVAGSLVSEEKIALPPDAVVTVYLVDVTRPESPRVIGKQVLSDGVGQVPVRFAVEFDPARIKPDSDYVVAANILAGGELRWKQAAPARVLTKGHPRFVNVRLAVPPRVGQAQVRPTGISHLTLNPVEQVTEGP